jgi:hypothetical protein
MARTQVILMGVLAAGLTAANASAVRQTAVCSRTGEAVRLRAVPEASGLAFGGTPPRLWTHNDSGAPVLFALDEVHPGSTPREVRLTGARVQDWEAVAVGRCPGGQCLYIADIGDNDLSRQRIRIFRTPVPAANAAIHQLDAFDAVYPDGPHDAEALFVTTAGQPFLITKEKAVATVYRFPDPMKAGSVNTLERVTRLPLSLVTDAGTSPDGEQLAVRTGHMLVRYRTADVVAGRATPVSTTDLRDLDEPQGEGVAIGSGGLVYLASEGGSAGGTLRTLRCSF